MRLHLLIIMGPLVGLQAGALLAAAPSASPIASSAWSSLLPAASEASDDVATARRAGLTAEALAAAGASVAEAEQVALATLAWLETDQGRGRVTQATAELREAERALQFAEGDLVGGQGDEGQVAACAEARSFRDEKRLAMQGLLDDLFTAAAAPLQSSKQSVLAVIRGNASRAVPVQYKAQQCQDEQDWVMLRRSLVDQRTAASLGVDPDPQLQLILSAWDALPVVASASTCLSATGETISGNWPDWLGSTCP